MSRVPARCSDWSAASERRAIMSDGMYTCSIVAILSRDENERGYVACTYRMNLSHRGRRYIDSQLFLPIK